MLWLISDLHYFHKSICLYSNRPYSSVEDMNEALIKNWNSVVKPNDEVWDLGDFSFGTYEQTCSVLKRLNGRHNFVMGNHDKVIKKNKEDLLKSGLLESIQDYKEIKYNGQMMVLFHYSLRTWNKAHYNSWCLWGHSHSSLEQPYGKSIDVGVDSKVITDEYRPVSFDEIKEFMDKVPVKIVDHHESRM